MNATRAVAVVLGGLLAQAAIAVAQAAPMRYTFYDCGTDITCTSQAPTVLTQFTTPDVILAPPVPPAGTLSSIERVDVDDVLAGSFDALGIFTANTNNRIGSFFVFNGLEPANDQLVTPVSAIGAATVAALNLNWLQGSYLGLGLVNCFNALCSQQTTIRAYVKLVAELDVPDVAAVPAPGALGLAGLALGLCFTTRRVGGQRQAGSAADPRR